MARISTSVDIPKEKIAVWSQLRKSEDTGKLATKAKVTKQTIRNAFKNAKADPYLVKIIDKFYSKRLDAINAKNSSLYEHAE